MVAFDGNYGKGVEEVSAPIVPNESHTFNKRYIKERDRLFRAFGFGGKSIKRGDEELNGGDTPCYDGYEFVCHLLTTGNISVIGRLMKYFEDGDTLILNELEGGDTEVASCGGDYGDFSDDDEIYKLVNGDGSSWLKKQAKYIPVQTRISLRVVEDMLFRAIEKYGVEMFLATLYRNDTVTFKHLVKLSGCALIELYGYDIVSTLLKHSRFDFLDVLLRGDNTVEALQLAIGTFTHKSWENLILFNNVLKRVEIGRDVANILSYIRFDELFTKANLKTHNKVYEFYLFS